MNHLKPALSDFRSIEERPAAWLILRDQIIVLQEKQIETSTQRRGIGVQGPVAVGV
jgi:hypothetical protein